MKNGKMEKLKDEKRPLRLPSRGERRFKTPPYSP
jgi:hypothetical protein